MADDPQAERKIPPPLMSDAPHLYRGYPIGPKPRADAIAEGERRQQQAKAEAATVRARFEANAAETAAPAPVKSARTTDQGKATNEASSPPKGTGTEPT